MTAEKINGKTVAEWRAFMENMTKIGISLMPNEHVVQFLDAIEARDKRIAKLEKELQLANHALDKFADIQFTREVTK